MDPLVHAAVHVVCTERGETFRGRADRKPLVEFVEFALALRVAHAGVVTLERLLARAVRAVDLALARITLVAVNVRQHLLSFTGEQPLLFVAQPFAGTFARLLCFTPRDEHAGFDALTVRPLETIDAEAQVLPLLAQAAARSEKLQTSLTHRAIGEVFGVVVLTDLQRFWAEVAVDEDHVGGARGERRDSERRIRGRVGG
jgi:hypothetical protein